MENEETPKDDGISPINTELPFISVFTLPSYGKAMKKNAEPISTLCKATEQESAMSKAAERIKNMFNDTYTDADESSNLLLVLSYEDNLFYIWSPSALTIKIVELI